MNDLNDTPPPRVVPPLKIKVEYGPDAAKEKAGPRQVKNASIGLTHNVGGQTGYLNAAVLLFGKRD